MFELHIKENLKVPNERTFKDNFTNTLYKRPFSIEKIKKDLNRIKNYNSRTSNNQDKHLLELTQIKRMVFKRWNRI